MNTLDIRQRFHEELRSAKLHGPLHLIGNPMQAAVAKILLQEHGISTADAGQDVALMSMEAYCSAFLKSFLEDVPPPTGASLLTLIPEHDIIAFAQAHGIPVLREERDHVREMLDGIAARQPQTYLSLRRSSDRLSAAADALRESHGK